MSTASFPKTLDRYILTQLLDYCLLGVVIFSLVAFFSNSFLNFIQDVQRYGISIQTALLMMGLQLPETVAMIMPVALFFAVLLVYNTLNNQFEIIALRMSGISLSRLMLPALLLGLVGAAITYALDDFVVPYAKTQIELLKQQAIQQASLPYGRKSFSFQTFDDNHRLEQMIYVSRYNGSLLKDTTVVDLTRPGVLQIIQAKTGTWSPANWEFHNANAYTIGKNNSTLVFNHLNTMQVMNMLNTAPKAKQESLTEQMKNPLYVDSANQNFAQMYQGIQNRAAAGVKVGTATVIRLWEKLTLPLSCFFMILTAVPLAIVPPRKGSQRGFLFALGVLFFYYMLRSVFVALGKSSIMSLGGLLPTPTALMLAAWMPLICIAALGVGLMYRKSRVL